ncbi:uncharacterized protein AMSG_03257 [Thecamonas trahens ATCC 50062]|uniref:Uncharacterized protein n=1 Tax=Thecamonas trahens ATCC 50062 TaxID=461836 RepID=A0A0L0D407_THETB|nr:hypothetical protein AMSG_03257 [Thecamonas trahens ATCC 50062]KNC46826.1 hypothetical protein AMSG_03257 [Thecamonas trahens ATCC 50062]|eukprot:XP_013760101.1 hypothetical protein AMSG_03257 [Thecamonas trahens ATCC 50062]
MSLPIVTHDSLTIAHSGAYSASLGAVEGEYETKLSMAYLERDATQMQLNEAQGIQATYCQTIAELEQALEDERAAHSATRAELNVAVASHNEEAAAARTALGTIEELRGTLRARDAELANAREWEIATNARLAELEADKRASRSAAGLLDARNTELRKVAEELASAKAEIESLRRNLHEARSDAAAADKAQLELTYEVRATNDELDRTRDELAALRDERQRLSSQLNTVLADRGEVEDQLNASALELGDERSLAMALENKIAAMAAELQAARDDALAAHQLALRLELDVRNSEAEAAIAVEAAESAAASRIADMEDRNAHLESVAQQAKLELDITKIALSKADMDRVRLMGDVEMLPALQASLDEAVARHEELALERDALHELMIVKVGVEERLEAASTALVELQESARAALAELDETKAALSNEREARTKLEAQLSVLEASSSERIAGLEAANIKLDKEALAAGNRVRQLTDTLQETHSKLEKALVDLNILQNQYDEVRTRDDRTATALATVREQAAQDAVAVVELRATVEYLQELCEDADAACASQANLAAAYEAQVRDLLAALEGAEAAAKAAHDAMASSRETYAAEKEELLERLSSAEASVRDQVEAAYRELEIEHAKAFGAARRGMDELGAELRETRAELAATKSRAEEMQASLVNTERFVTHYAEQARNATAELSSSKAELDTVLGTRSELAAKVTALEAQLAEASRDAAAMAAEVDAHSAEAAALAERVADYEAQLRELDTVVEASMMEKAQAVGYVNQLLEGEAATAEAVATLEARVDELTAELATAGPARVATLESELAQIRHAHDTRGEELSKTEALLASSRLQTDSLAATVENLKNEAAEAAREAKALRDLEKEHAVTGFKLETISAELSAAVERANREQARADAAVRRVTELEAAVAQARDDADRARRAADSAESRLAAMPSQAELHDASLMGERLAEARTRVTELETRLATLHDSQMSASAARTAAEARAAESASAAAVELAGARSEAAAAQRRAEDTAAELARAQAEVTRLTGIASRLEASLEHATADAQAAKKTAAELTARLEATQDKCKEAAEAAAQAETRAALAEQETGVARHALASAHDDYIGLKKTMEGAEAAAKAALAELRRNTDRQLADAERASTKLSAELEAVRSEIASRRATEDTVRTLEAKLVCLRKELDSVQAEALAASSRAHALEEACESRASELAQLRGANERLEDEVASARRSARQHVAEAESLRDRLDGRAREVAKLERELALCTQQLEHVEDALTDAHLRPQSRTPVMGSGLAAWELATTPPFDSCKENVRSGYESDDAAVLRQKLGEMLATVEGLRDVLVASEEAISRSKAENAELRTQVSEFEDALLMQSVGASSLRSTSEANQLRQDLELERARASQAIKEAKLLRAQLSQARTAASAETSQRIHQASTRQRQEMEELRRTVDDLQERIAQLVRENSELQTRLTAATSSSSREQANLTRATQAAERKMMDALHREQMLKNDLASRTISLRGDGVVVASNMSGVPPLMGLTNLGRLAEEPGNEFDASKVDLNAFYADLADDEWQAHGEAGVQRAKPTVRFTTPRSSLEEAQYTTAMLDNIEATVNSALSEYDEAQREAASVDSGLSELLSSEAQRHAARGQVNVIIVNYEALCITREEALKSLRRWFDAAADGVFDDIDIHIEEAATAPLEEAFQTALGSTAKLKTIKDSMVSLYRSEVNRNFDLLDASKELSGKRVKALRDAVKSGKQKIFAKERELQTSREKIAKLEAKVASLTLVLESKDREIDELLASNESSFASHITSMQASAAAEASSWRATLDALGFGDDDDDDELGDSAALVEKYKNLKNHARKLKRMYQALVKDTEAFKALTVVREKKAERTVAKMQSALRLQRGINARRGGLGSQTSLASLTGGDAIDDELSMFEDPVFREYVASLHAEVSAELEEVRASAAAEKTAMETAHAREVQSLKAQILTMARTDDSTTGPLLALNASLESKIHDLEVKLKSIRSEAEAAADAKIAKIKAASEATVASLQKTLAQRAAKRAADHKEHGVDEPELQGSPASSPSLRGRRGKSGRSRGSGRRGRAGRGKRGRKGQGGGRKESREVVVSDVNGDDYAALEAEVRRLSEELASARARTTESGPSTMLAPSAGLTTPDEAVPSPLPPLVATEEAAASRSVLLGLLSDARLLSDDPEVLIDDEGQVGERQVSSGQPAVGLAPSTVAQTSDKLASRLLSLESQTTDAMKVYLERDRLQTRLASMRRLYLSEKQALYTQIQNLTNQKQAALDAEQRALAAARMSQGEAAEVRARLMAALDETRRLADEHSLALERARDAEDETTRFVVLAEEHAAELDVLSRQLEEDPGVHLDSASLLRELSEAQTERSRLMSLVTSTRNASQALRDHITELEQQLVRERTEAQAEREAFARERVQADEDIGGPRILVSKASLADLTIETGCNSELEQQADGIEASVESVPSSVQIGLGGRGGRSRRAQRTSDGSGTPRTPISPAFSGPECPGGRETEERLVRELGKAKKEIVRLKSRLRWAEDKLKYVMDDDASMSDESSISDFGLGPGVGKGGGGKEVNASAVYSLQDKLKGARMKLRAAIVRYEFAEKTNAEMEAQIGRLVGRLNAGRDVGAQALDVSTGELSAIKDGGLPNVVDQVTTLDAASGASQGARVGGSEAAHTEMFVDGYMAMMAVNAELKVKVREQTDEVMRLLDGQEGLRKIVRDWQASGAALQRERDELKLKVADMASEREEMSKVTRAYLRSVSEKHDQAIVLLRKIETELVGQIKNLNTKLTAAVIAGDKGERRSRAFHRSQVAKISAGYDERISDLQQALGAEMGPDSIAAVLKSDYEKALAQRAADLEREASVHRMELASEARAVLAMSREAYRGAHVAALRMSACVRVVHAGVGARLARLGVVPDDFLTQAFVAEPRLFDNELASALEEIDAAELPGEGGEAEYGKFAAQLEGHLRTTNNELDAAANETRMACAEVWKFVAMLEEGVEKKNAAAEEAVVEAKAAVVSKTAALDAARVETIGLQHQVEQLKEQLASARILASGESGSGSQNNGGATAHGLSLVETLRAERKAVAAEREKLMAERRGQRRSSIAYGSREPSEAELRKQPRERKMSISGRSPAPGRLLGSSSNTFGAVDADTAAGLGVVGSVSMSSTGEGEHVGRSVTEVDPKARAAFARILAGKEQQHASALERLQRVVAYQAQQIHELKTAPMAQGNALLPPGLPTRGVPRRGSSVSPAVNALSRGVAAARDDAAAANSPAGAAGHMASPSAAADLGLEGGGSSTLQLFLERQRLIAELGETRAALMEARRVLESQALAADPQAQAEIKAYLGRDAQLRRAKTTALFRKFTAGVQAQDSARQRAALEATGSGDDTMMDALKRMEMWHGAKVAMWEAKKAAIVAERQRQAEAVLAVLNSVTLTRRLQHDDGDGTFFYGVGYWSSEMAAIHELEVASRIGQPVLRVERIPLRQASGLLPLERHREWSPIKARTADVVAADVADSFPSLNRYDRLPGISPTRFG